MTENTPEIEVIPVRRSLRERISIVWLVPLAALLTALGVALQAWVTRGPVIEIMFEEASGVKPRETELRYRDVTVGLVERVSFADGLNQVVVSVRLDKEIAPFVDGDAEFWVVKPEVSTRGVRGLETVLSGVFIEGVWDASADGLVEQHEGRPAAPLLRPGEEGLEITLRALPGVTLSESTPILYKGIEAGRVGAATLASGGSTAAAPAVIYAPYDRLVHSTTRFWDTSGFSFSLGASGAELDFSSLSSLIAGGVAFDTMVSGGQPARAGAEFDVFASQDDARNNLFEGGRGPGAAFTMIFEDNVSGLETGAPVELRGLKIGEVTGISGLVDPLRFQDRKVRLMVTAELRPSDFGILDAQDPDTVVEYIAERVGAGLRARLASTSLLTGGLKVELLEVPEAPPAELDLGADPYPIIPVVDSNISDVDATVQGMLQRVGQLPVEELMQSAIRFLDNSTLLVRDEDLRNIPADVRALLGEVRGVVGSDELQALPEQAAGLMEELGGAVADLRGVLARLEEARAVERLVEAVEAVGSAAGSVGGSVEGVPDLLASLTETADTVRELPLEQLISRASGVVEAAEALLEQDSTRDLPATLNGALDQLRLALSELREGGTVEAVNSTLASAEAAAAAVEEAAAELPALSGRLDRLLLRASSTLQDYQANSEFNRAARRALSEIQQAANAVERLARALERRPNSIILGR
ncbi:PqiB family protein (plasmid) [Roseobacteraceae bacterium NS-SX3]